MLNGPVGLLIAAVFVAVVLLGGAAMSSLAELLERKVKQRRLERDRAREIDKPGETRRAA